MYAGTRTMPIQRHTRLPYTPILIALLASCAQDIAVFADDLTPAEIRQALLDPDFNPSPFDRDAKKPWYALQELSKEDQLTILREVAEDGPLQSAAPALGMLIVQHQDIGVIDVIVQRLPDMIEESDRYDASLLQMIWQHVADRAQWIELPRHILQWHIDELSEYQRDDRALHAVDYAAMLLQDSNEPEDKQLVQSAVLEFAESPELWIALTKMDALDVPQKIVALTMYKDQDLPQELRIATAVALAQEVSDAEEAAKEEIESVVDEYGAFDYELAMQKISDPSVDRNDNDIRRFFNFHVSGKIVMMIGLLPEDTAKELVDRALGVENNAIRVAAASTAAEFMPDWLLEHDLPTLAEIDRNGVLAYLVHKHPAKSEAARERSPDAQTFDHIRDQIQVEGVTLALMKAGVGDPTR